MFICTALTPALLHCSPVLTWNKNKILKNWPPSLDYSKSNKFVICTTPSREWKWKLVLATSVQTSWTSWTFLENGTHWLTMFILNFKKDTVPGIMARPNFNNWQHCKQRFPSSSASGNKEVKRSYIQSLHTDPKASYDSVIDSTETTKTSNSF